MIWVKNNWLLFKKRLYMNKKKIKIGQKYKKNIF